MRNRIQVHPLSLPGAVVVLALVAMAPALSAGERGSCVVADVPAPYVLTDGSLHPAGPIRLCIEYAASPGSGVHRIGASDGVSTVTLSRRARTEGSEAATPTVFFHRQGDSTLALVGYVVPENGRAYRYVMRPEAFRARNATPNPPSATVLPGDLVAVVATTR